MLTLDMEEFTFKIWDFGPPGAKPQQPTLVTEARVEKGDKIQSSVAGESVQIFYQVQDEDVSR